MFFIHRLGQGVRKLNFDLDQVTPRSRFSTILLAHKSSIATCAKFNIFKKLIMKIRKKWNVFVVDDNEITKTLLRLIVKGDGYVVVGDAGSAKVAKERILRLRPNIICLDVMLPDSEGLELLEWVRSALPDSIVLMVTAKNDIGTFDAARKLGANGFIVKPFNPAMILDTLNRVISQDGR